MTTATTLKSMSHSLQMHKLLTPVMATLSTFKEAHLDVDALTDDTDAATEEALQQVEDVVQ